MVMHGFGEIAEQLRRSTVLVLPGERGNGSGVIWSADSVIVTNSHVVRASQMRVQLWDGRAIDAALVSRVTGRDLSDLRICPPNRSSPAVADSSPFCPGFV